MDWLAELNDTIEMESWFEIQSSDAKELRDFILEKDAEIERLREALRNIAMRGPDGELWNTKAEIWMIAENALQQKESE